MSLTPEPIRTCVCGCRYVQRKHHKSGKFAPIELTPNPYGNIHVQADGTYRVIPKGEDFTGERHLNHFATCPERQRFGGA